MSLPPRERGTSGTPFCCLSDSIVPKAVCTMHEPYLHRIIPSSSQKLQKSTFWHDHRDQFERTLSWVQVTLPLVPRDES
jgi:hypothetical protein